jgi:hypothetical protein
LRSGLDVGSYVNKAPDGKVYLSKHSYRPEGTNDLWGSGKYAGPIEQDLDCSTVFGACRGSGQPPGRRRRLRQTASLLGFSDTDPVNERGSIVSDCKKGGVLCCRCQNSGDETGNYVDLYRESGDD